MTSRVSAIEAIEKAMEGVTPGPWYPGHLGTDSTCQCRSIVDDGSYMGAIAAVHVSNGLPVGEGGNDSPPAEEAAANMRYIAACNPVAMREVLALARQAEALQRENAELRAVMKECHAALKMMISPGDISGSTVLGAFAAAKSAEARARATLAATRSGSATSASGTSAIRQRGESE